MLEQIDRHKTWLLPILLMLAITPFTPWLDLAFARSFYTEGADGAHFYSHPALEFIYVYALVPGQITVILALSALLLSYVVPRQFTWRPPALCLVLTLAVGAGFITHTLLKDHWGRPRPRQVVEFGGQQDFRPFWRPNFFRQPEPSKSFPCGHCTMGFYFFTFIFLGKRYRKRWLVYAGIALSAVIGITLGLTRMMQGGHFLSDVLVSALIMWLTAFVIDRLIFEDQT